MGPSLSCECIERKNSLIKVQDSHASLLELSDLVDQANYIAAIRITLEVYVTLYFLDHLVPDSVTHEYPP